MTWGSTAAHALPGHMWPGSDVGVAMLRSSAGDAPTMPGGVVDQSCRRIRLAGLVIGSLWSLALLMNVVVVGAVGVQSRRPGGLWPWPGAAIAMIGAAVSLGLAAAAGRWRDRPKRTIELGLSFQVVTSALIALHTQWTPTIHAGAVSWTAVMIAIFPWITVTTVRKVLVTALVAASMDPLAVLLAHARGVGYDASTFDLIWYFLPSYAFALLTVVPTSILRRLGRQVSRARELGSYRLGERLGGGGMGDVYDASHRLLARPSAVKVIRPDQLGDQSSPAAQRTIERFWREADAAASLRSVHTIELYDFGVAEDGTLYYAMERLDGVDLNVLVRQFGPLPAARAIHLMRQACSSLAEAHMRGLVHRDIKPSNIFVCRMGLTPDFVKVLDFGLVKRIEQDDARQATLTNAELLTGTPGFVAPEVIAGEGEADHRSDIYALGCVMYWLLTGTPVFGAPNTMALLMRHLDGMPEPPSRRTANPIPPELDDIVLACLAKRPDHRIRDAQELDRRLRAVAVADAWTEESMSEWWTAHLDAGAPAIGS